MTKVTIPIPRSLHRRIKLSCASRQIAMADAMAEALANTPWPISEAA